MRPRVFAAALGVSAAALAWLGLALPPQSSSPVEDAGIGLLLQAVQGIATSGSPVGYGQLLSRTANKAAAAAFADANFTGPADRATLRERDRTPLPGVSLGDGYRLIVEILRESGSRGRLATWRLDVVRDTSPHDNPAEDGSHDDVIVQNQAEVESHSAISVWRIESQRELNALTLYRLALDPRRQLAVHDLVVKAEDLALTLHRGAAFAADVGGGPTALVLVGKGEMQFSPAPESERGQIKLLSGGDALRTSFDTCLIRLNPSDLAQYLAGTPETVAVDAGALRRAEQVFAADAVRSFTVDLGDLSPGPWSIEPAPGDFLAEIDTPRYGALTYSRSGREMEDISLFDRAHRRYLALYASKEKLAGRGRFFADDGLADYDALHYDVEASFSPEEQRIEGRTSVRLRVRAASVSALQLRLADSLTVQSVTADTPDSRPPTPDRAGRVLAVRVRGQDAVIVRLPEPLSRGAEMTLTVAYAGRLSPQSSSPDIAASAGPATSRQLAPLVEATYLYGVRSAWYPQAPVPGYATATLRLSVPAPYDCVASGTLVSTSALSTAARPPAAPRRQFVFEARQPVRYLACLIGRLTPFDHVTVGTTRLSVVTNVDDKERVSETAREADDIWRYYASVVGDSPYPAITVAFVGQQLPGGDSPPYLVVLHDQVATSRLAWRDDPTSFRGFPEFFVAHELAHQWWGQAVGTKNYHEEWLSEAFAQYFAALYAEHAHGRAVFDSIMREMDRWTLRDSADGPVYLGDRVGQVKADSREFRAIVYDKGALVLHMLRRLVGDAAFFRGLRRFYADWRFRKAGTDDLRKAFEAESGMQLDTFFERWIYGDTLPRLKFAWRTEPGSNGGEDVVLRFEQLGDVFDVPVTATIDYAGRPPVDLVVPVTGRLVERRIPAAGRVRNVVANRDELAPGTVVH